MPANLAGAHGGGHIISDSNGNVYLYIIPWSVAFNNSPTLTSTTTRVKVGQVIGGTFYCADILSNTTTTLCPSVTSRWEIYDIDNLQNNVAWPGNWIKTFCNGIPSCVYKYSGQSTLTGWQLGWITSSNFITFTVNAGDFFVEHDPNHLLSDPSGWYVAQRGGVNQMTGANTLPDSAFGGPFDVAHGCGYVVTAGTPLVGYCGFQ